MSDQIFNITDFPAEVDWRFTRGDTLLQEVILEDEDSEGTVIPANLTGSTFEMVVTDNRGEVVATLALGSGLSVIAAGTLRIHVVAATTATWPDLKCDTTFALKWTRATTPVIVKTVIKGKI